MALDEEDWASWNFLQWFVKNKLKKKILQNLLDKIKIVGGEKTNGDALYL
jgi:ferritin